MRIPELGSTFPEGAGATPGVCALLQAMDASNRTRRRSERRAPAHPVIVSAEAEDASATGEAVNLSAGGVCLALEDRMFEVGDELILWMHFARPKQAVPATGRVVWAGSGRKRPRCGLEWTHEGPQRNWIGWLTGVQLVGSSRRA
jgi:Tfp pilus assembly protein PilZ